MKKLNEISEQILDTNPNKLKTVINYNKIFSDIATKKITRQEKLQLYKYLILNDLYFLLRYIFNREDMEKQWIYDRCREVQKLNNNTVDIWARFHYKSTIITFGLTIQEMLKYPDYCFIIFSHTKSMAYKFLKSIKNAIKSTELLKILFPDVIPDPDDQSRLSEEKIRLLTNKFRKEDTLMASGLVDGQPTGMHYEVRIYDDVVVPESVSTPDQMKKLQDAFELSHFLSDNNIDKMRIVGTRYHHADLFSVLKEKPIYIIREYPAEVNGKPITFMTEEQLKKYRMRMGSYTYACQMLLNPSEQENKPFHKEDILLFNTAYTELNIKKIGIFVDPAISEKQQADYFVAMVVGISQDHNIYVIDYVSGIGILPKRQAEIIFNLYMRYNRPTIYIEQVAYQKALRYIVDDYFRDMGVIPRIEELKADKSKRERILALQPYFENRQIHIRSYMKELIKEIDEYPYSKHDDHIDTLAYSMVMFTPKKKINDIKIEGNIDRLKVIGNNRINKYQRRVKWQVRRAIVY